MSKMKMGILGKLVKSIANITYQKIGNEYYLTEKSNYNKVNKSQLEVTNMAINKEYQKLLSLIYQSLKNIRKYPIPNNKTYYNLLQKSNKSNYYANGAINYSLIDLTAIKVNHFIITKVKFNSARKMIQLVLNRNHNKQFLNQFTSTIFLIYNPSSGWIKSYDFESIFEVGNLFINDINTDLIGDIHVFSYMYKSNQGIYSATSYKKN